MSYEKTVWKARQGSGLNRFNKSQESGGSVVLENAPIEVSEQGTPFSVDNMNKIEQGIYDAHEMIADEEEARAQGDGAALAAAKDYADARLLALNEWLPPVQTAAQLSASGLDNAKTYLCKVVADPVQSGVYQAVGGVWSLYDDTVDLVSEEELAAALAGLPEGASESFTFVVDSDQALADWANDAGGNDYSRVLIRAGTWTLNTALTGGNLGNPLAVIDISNGRTRVVVGESGCKIVINNEPSGAACVCGIKGCVGGNYPGFIDPGNDYYFENVSLKISQGGSSISSFSFYSCSNLTNCRGESCAGGDGSAYGFYNCLNLTNCTDISFASTIGHSFYFCSNLTNCMARIASSNAGYGFYRCSNLENCMGEGVNHGATTSHVSGFFDCANLTNCTGKGSSNVSPSGGYSGFYGCTNLTNCTGEGSDTSSSSPTGGGFSNCTNLTNCTGKGTGYSFVRGFYQCSNLTNCKGEGITAEQSYGEGIGFSGCTNLTNCTGEGNSPNGTGIGFYDCAKLTNCTGCGTRYNYNYGGGLGFGFFNCRTGFGCKKGFSSKTAVFYNCYMEQEYGTTPWDNTAAGGYNNPDN